MSTVFDVSGRGIASEPSFGEHRFEVGDQLLLDLAPIAVYVCDRAGLIVRHNRHAVDLWGRAPRLHDPQERFCGSFKLYRMDGESLPHSQCPMAEVLRTGRSARDQELIVERPDGSRAVVLVNIEPLRDQSGHLVGAINCFHDITQRKRLEEELRTSQRDLEDFFDNAVVALHWVSAHGTILRANRAELDLLGYSREEYVGRHIGEFYEDPAQAAAVLARLAAGENLDRHPVRLRAKGGEIKTVLVSSSAYFRDGQFVHTRCFTIDITDRARAESELRSVERRSREILEALPVAVYTTDPEGRITFYNQAAQTLWGHTPQLGESEWCGSWRLRWPDGAPMPHHHCPMAVALKEGRTITGAQAIAERADGTWVPFLAYPTPLHDEAGNLIGAVNALVDTSEYRRNEELTHRLAWLVESSQDAIVSKDLNGVVTSWNQGAEQLFGYTAQEMVGKPITLLFPPDRRDEENQILERLRRGELIDHYETVRLRKDGTPVEISLTVSPIKNAQGEVIGASKVARDIEARKRVQEQQDLLLREMVHRVKNLFSLVSGMIALSTRSVRTPQELATALQARLGALSRAHELTLPERGAALQKADRTTTLDALLHAIICPHADANDSTGERVIMSGPSVTIGGSAITSFALLLHELATNAVKYGALSSAQGRVHVEWSVDEHELELTWTESGGPQLDSGEHGEGFGSLLARQTVTSQFRGQISRDWRSEGLVVRLSARLDRLSR